MNLAQLTVIAELIAAAGVIASLIFVALEVRKNTAQTRQANWGNAADRFNAVYAQTDDIALAELIVKGRQNYHDLSEAEKISFGHYLEQLCIAIEALIIHGESVAHGREANVALARKHLAFHLGFPGARQWYEEFDEQRGYPPAMREFIKETIQQV